MLIEKNNTMKVLRIEFMSYSQYIYSNRRIAMHNDNRQEHSVNQGKTEAKSSSQDRLTFKVKRMRPSVEKTDAAKGLKNERCREARGFPSECWTFERVGQKRRTKGVNKTKKE